MTFLMIGLRYLNAFGIGNDLIEQLGNAVQHILIDHIDRGFAFGALPPCICLAASVEASMHSAAAVRADDRSVQPEDTLAIIYILLGVKKSGNDLLCNVTYVYNGNNQVTDIFGSCDDNDNKDKHVVLSYDANGNLIKSECNDTEKVVDYTYDNENRLKAVKENGTLLMAALYDGNGDRIFRLDYRKNPQYISNRGGTADNVYYNYSSGGISYDHDMIRDEMLIPNDITQNTSINYELTGYNETTIILLQ